MERSTAHIEAWKTVNANGMLPKRRLEVYNALFEHGPCTASQLTRFIRGKDGSPLELTVDHRRLLGLEEQGVVLRLNAYTSVSEVAERISTANGLLEWQDKETDEWANVWDVTDRLPSKPVVTPTTLKPTKSELKEAHAALLDFYYLLDPEYYQEHNAGRSPPPIISDSIRAAAIRKLGIWVKKLSQ